MRRLRHLKKSQPEVYAVGAIAELTRQLLENKSETKKQKIKSRLEFWRKKSEQL